MVKRALESISDLEDKPLRPDDVAQFGFRGVLYEFEVREGGELGVFGASVYCTATCQGVTLASECLLPGRDVATLASQMPALVGQWQSFEPRVRRKIEQMRQVVRDDMAQRRLELHFADASRAMLGWLQEAISLLSLRDGSVEYRPKPYPMVMLAGGEVEIVPAWHMVRTLTGEKPQYGFSVQYYETTPATRWEPESVSEVEDFVTSSWSLAAKRALALLVQRRLESYDYMRGNDESEGEPYG